MTLLTMPCRCCSRDIVFPPEVEAMECTACFTLNSRPRAEGASLEVLRRATAQRLRCDFHNAEISYQHVLLDCPEEHEALWGLALCRYGVEYVDDPKTRRRMPVVHGVRTKPMQLDGDFQQACDLAPEEVRTQYEQDAAYIDDAMAKIRELAKTCPPFDVFICHKTTKPDSKEYTEDYNRAFKLYHLLDKQGYRAFFAPMEMEGVSAGSDYEAGIYHALDTARVMLVVCSNEDYLNSPWVRNEWRRFLEMGDAGEDKCLLPLMYGELSPSKLPRDFRVRKLQAIVMGEMGSAEKVVETIRKYAVSSKSSTPVQPKPVQVPEAAPVSQPAAVPPKSHDEKPVPEPAPKHTVLLQPEPQITAAVAYAPESDFDAEVVDDGVRITKYTGHGDEVKIPPTLRGMKVVSIGDRAFSPCANLKAVVIPDGVTSIGDFAFWGCSNLTSVNIPNSMTCIGKSAFSGCDNLASVNIPNSITNIGESAFFVCGSLTSVNIPNSVTSIGESAFQGCRNLTSVNIPSSVTTIEKCTFSQCSNLASVNIPSSVTSIGDLAFWQCYRLTNVNIPNSVTNIGDRAFWLCRKLTSINIPDSVTNIGDCAFEKHITLTLHEDSPAHRYALQNNIRFQLIPDEPPSAESAPVSEAESAFQIKKTGTCCTITQYTGSAEHLAIPAVIQGLPVTAIDAEAFRGNMTLTSVTIPEGVSAIYYAAFRECTCLQHVSLPESLLTIQGNAFQSCRQLREIKLPQALSTIQSYTFNACQSLTSIVIPENVVSIGESAFDYCTKLITVTLPQGIREIGNNAFYRCYELSRINLSANVKLGKDVFGQCKKLPASVTRRSSTSIFGFIDKILPF